MGHILELMCERAHAVPFSALSITFAVLIPASLVTVHWLARFPSIKRSQLQISPGLTSLIRSTDASTSAERTRLQEIYPENLLGDAHYADLPYGRTKYALLGPEDGLKVVLVHGFSAASVIYKDVARVLASEGFRVLTLDLYGRGYSDAPQIPNHTQLFTSQIALLLQHVGWDKARIVGLSMGGGIVASFAAMFPNLVDGHVAFLASAGNFPDDYFPFQTRIVTRVGFSIVPYFRGFMRKIRKLGPLPSSFQSKLLQLTSIQMRTLDGYPRALESSVVNGPIRGLGTAFKTLGKRDNLKILLVHGTADQVVPYYPFLSPILTDFMPNAKLVTLKGYGHEVVATDPSIVADALVDFFNET